MKNYRYAVVAVLSASLCLLSITGLSGTNPAPLSLEQVIEKLQANYQDVNTYEVDFDQQVIGVTQGRVISTSTGSVKYKKPNQMVWHYASPEEHLFITDGATIYDYCPADKEAYVLPMKDAIVKSFLLGLGDVKKDFEVSFHSGRALDKSGRYQLDLVPRNQAEREVIGAITLYLNPKNGFMVEVTEMVDPLGNHNQITYKNMKKNLPIDDKLFKFEPPPGVKIINAKDLLE